MNTPETMQAHNEWVNERIALQNRLTQGQITIVEYNNLAILASDTYYQKVQFILNQFS